MTDESNSSGNLNDSKWLTNMWKHVAWGKNYIQRIGKLFKIKQSNIQLCQIRIHQKKKEKKLTVNSLSIMSNSSVEVFCVGKLDWILLLLNAWPPLENLIRGVRYLPDVQVKYLAVLIWQPIWTHLHKIKLDETQRKTIERNREKIWVEVFWCFRSRLKWHNFTLSKMEA